MEHLLCELLRSSGSMNHRRTRCFGDLTGHREYHLLISEARNSKMFLPKIWTAHSDLLFVSRDGQVAMAQSD